MDAYRELAEGGARERVTWTRPALGSAAASHDEGVDAHAASVSGRVQRAGTEGGARESGARRVTVLSHQRPY